MKDGFQVTFEPSGRRVSCPPGTDWLEAARRAGIGLVATCGGQGRCGKCRVLPAVSGAPLPEERRHLTPTELAQGYRLACRHRVDRDLVLRVPASGLDPDWVSDAGATVELPAVPPEGLVGVPVVSWHDLDPPVDTVSGDVLVRRLRADCGLDVRAIDLGVVRRSAPGARAAAVRGTEVIALSTRPGPTPVGLAVDLGTTTVVACLADLSDGTLLAIAAVANPQAAYGADVISRLARALRGDSEELRAAAVAGVNAAADAACRMAGIEPAAILEAVVVGNTAMHHLFLGLPVDRLAVSPFAPTLAQPLWVRARDLGIAAAPGARVFLPPPIGGYIGSDHLALLEVLEIRRRPGNHLVVDIGTNTEVTLKTAGGRLLGCSCASGPAFEGAHIRHGMRARPGAVDRVRIDPATGRAVVHTVGDRPPLGIAGTGILEAVAELRAAGLLGPSGGFVGGPGVRPAIDGREFLLVAADGGDLVVTQGDVQAVLLAKGAVRSGVEVLLHEAGVAAAELDACWVAGAFGTHLDPAVAVRVGMFPAVAAERFRVVGNAAAAGARLLLCFPARRLAAEALTSLLEYRDLGSHPAFGEVFARAMLLP